MAQLVEQAGILDGDDGLSREVRQQLDLLVGERPNFLAVDHYRPDQPIVLDHRHNDDRARAAEIANCRDRRIAFPVRRCRGQVLDMDDPLCLHDFSVGRDRMRPYHFVQPGLHKGGRHVVVRSDFEH